MVKVIILSLIDIAQYRIEDVIDPFHPRISIFNPFTPGKRIILAVFFLTTLSRLRSYKERRGKRIPIHKILVRIFDDAKQARSSSHDQVFLNPEGSIRHEDSLTPCWMTAIRAVGFDPKPTVHHLQHCWFTNAVRSKVYPYIADAILGHGDKKKSLQALYLTISDEDLLAAIDMMKFDKGKTAIKGRKSFS